MKEGTRSTARSACILLQNYYDIDIRVRRKAEALVSAGWSVDVLALRSHHGHKTYILNGVNVRTILLGKRRSSLARYVFEYLAFFFWALFRLTIQMPRRRYALVDVNTLPDFLVFASILAKWKGAKVILDMHEITPEFYISRYGIAEKSWLVRILKYQEKISFGFADHVITINEPIQDLLASRGLPLAKATVIMNTADETRFSKESPSAPGVDRPDASTTFVMMYHGTLTRIYGLDIAIEAFRIAQAEMTNAELWILGDGPEEGTLARLSQEYALSSRVKLFGRVPLAEISGWLTKCDAGILPIRRDVFLEFAFPNKLAEFIIMGKPVVVSRLRAIRHYFSEEALAYFEANNPVDLATQMVRIYRDHKMRVRMTAKAKEEYQPIRWDVMKGRYLRMIEEVVGPASRPDGQSLVVEPAGVSR